MGGAAAPAAGEGRLHRQPAVGVWEFVCVCVSGCAACAVHCYRAHSVEVVEVEQVTVLCLIAARSGLLECWLGFRLAGAVTAAGRDCAMGAFLVHTFTADCKRQQAETAGLGSPSKALHLPTQQQLCDFIAAAGLSLHVQRSRLACYQHVWWCWCGTLRLCRAIHVLSRLCVVRVLVLAGQASVAACDPLGLPGRCQVARTAGRQSAAFVGVSADAAGIVSTSLMLSHGGACRHTKVVLGGWVGFAGGTFASRAASDWCACDFEGNKGVKGPDEAQALKTAAAWHPAGGGKRGHALQRTKQHAFQGGTETGGMHLEGLKHQHISRQPHGHMQANTSTPAPEGPSLRLRGGILLR